MRKKTLSVSIKILVSALFLFVVLKKIDIGSLGEIFRNCYLPLMIPALAVIVGLTFLLCLRWYVLIRNFTDKKLSFFFFWKLTVVGIFFNNFLPTGAGGDIVKIFYLVKGEKNKLLLGSSVLIDRFIGAITVITMGLVALLFTKGLHRNVYTGIIGLFFVLCLLLTILSSRKCAVVIHKFIKKILPDKVENKIITLYNVFYSYFSQRKHIVFSLITSFILQAIMIVCQYVIAVSLFRGTFFPGTLQTFFVYIPLIWVATLMPSLGGLGIREFSYVLFFSQSLGKDKAFALSLIVLLSMLLQSLIGAITFLTLRTGQKTVDEN